MVLAELNNSSIHAYGKLHPLFEKAFAYLLETNVSDFVEGKFEILGDDLFSIQSMNGNSKVEVPKLEAHKKYIDIHYIVQGSELFGWKDITLCLKPEGDFNVEKDYIFYDDQVFSEFRLLKNNFVIVFPEDAHAPLIETKELYKIVLKIKVN